MIRRRVPVDSRLPSWSRNIADAINYLLDKVEGVTGMRDAANSTTTPLGAGATFTGEWVQNDHAQLAFNVLSDTDGTFYLEFSIDGTDTLQTLSKSYQVFADDPQFDALVKMPGRYHRVRFVNAGGAQTSFGIVTSTANDGLFPYSISGRDAPKFGISAALGVSSTTWKIAVDLSDRTTFPHHFTGRIDLYSVFFSVAKGNNSVGSVRLGVITRVDETSADVTFVQGMSFTGADSRSVTRDRVFNTPLTLGQSGGVLTGITPGATETGITAINTGGALATPYGTATPAVGDLVAKFEFTSGAAFDAFASFQYATDTRTT